MIIPLGISAIALIITLIVASVEDIRTRTVYRITWYPAAIIGIICAIIYWISAIHTNIPALILSLITIVLMAVFSLFGLFGKADAKALILIAVAVPINPFISEQFPSLALATLINAGLIIFIYALCLLFWNLIKGNRAPIFLMCSGYPVQGSNLLAHHGFIAETVEEKKDKSIQKSYRKTFSSLSALKNESPYMIRTLKENKEKYQNQIDLYARCKTIWITAGVPFLIPITIGFILALCGISSLDILLTLFL